ncbi:MAG: mechanosensitive ion channel family protein, partial [Candidatus Thorarchaeota archaeon]
KRQSRITMLQQTPPDFLVDPIGYIQFYWTQISPYLFLALALLIIAFLYIFMIRIAKRSLLAVGMGREATTGIVLILRLIFFMITIILLIGFFEADTAAIISVSAIFGTALGLAFSTALSNIVSGLYVLTARPFRVGDYVRIGVAEGIVREITLNYTRILLPDENVQLVPNNKVVSSEVTNFRIDISQFVQKKEEEEEARSSATPHSYRKTLDDAWKQLKVLAKDEIAYRYTFDLNVHMSQDHSEILQNFDRVCNEWATVFLIRPDYIVWAKPVAAITYRFSFIVKDPMVIIKEGSNFMKDLLQSYYEG